MKNPFHLNLLVLLSLTIIFIIVLFSHDGDCSSTSSKAENIYLNVLASVILLLLIESILFINDLLKFGFVEGLYYRKAIYQVNDKGLRGTQIPDNISDDNERRKKRQDLVENKGEKYSDDSIYHEMVYYKCTDTKYAIRLNYEFHGIYSGTAEYFFHDSYSGRWQDRVIKKTKAFITLNLNSANRMTGTGSYKYDSVDDYGKFEFHINEQNKKELIVYYKNTIPSGLAEGYEIWEKVL